MKQLDVKEGNKHEEEICFTYKKKKYIAFIRDYSSLENYTLFFFLEWLYDLISLYKHRYLGSSYFYPISHFIQYPDRIAFIHGGGFNAKISFFDRAKTLFLTKEDKTNEIAINYEILS
ncbi:MAG: hypothetical protein LBI53_00335 [Candidatus Peribacteria bacterium]|jgi:hypothetical protein|nr:hypothetical protein [Candidatus Peribacteria bacterium]